MSKKTLNILLAIIPQTKKPHESGTRCCEKLIAYYYDIYLILMAISLIFIKNNYLWVPVI